MSTWDLSDGVVEFPSGRRVRGRSWHHPVDEYADVTVILTTAPPEEFDSRRDFYGGTELIFIQWPDYRLPRRPVQAQEQLRGIYERLNDEKIEIVCAGGVGRTGTALAALAIEDGLEPREAIDFVQKNYNSESATSHAQRGWLLDIQPSA